MTSSNEYDSGTRPGASRAKGEMADLIRQKVETLRIRLLDSSRRNYLIQVPFRQNSSSLIRFVDELPEQLAIRLTNQQSMRLVPLPPIDEPLPDEQTDSFLEAFYLARSSDELYGAALDSLQPTDPNYAQKELDAERALKDRVREQLGLPQRQTSQNPSLAAHARNHGISPDYTLPYSGDAHEDGRHSDNDIQTLLLPDRLERVARGLHDKGHSFERETGVNVLHAVFGLLEWNEPGSSRPPCLSPLLLLEVRMSRDKAPSGAEYRIAGEGEGIVVNTTLRQTLISQYGLELPAFDIEEMTLEGYLAAVSALSPKGWTWSVRREALVGVFPSNRIAMYHDLNPDTGEIADHPLIEQMLGTAGGQSAASYAEVYETDLPEVERAVPHLIMDADASQFSALVDAAQGKDMAIEGPPGSGKSQTIVNLIAAAMSEGKKVLFVAEKLTALEVVKNRLDAAGLGEFVLPLQAGSGSREAVFKSLEDRLQAIAPPFGIKDRFSQRFLGLTQRRSEMQAFLEMLGTPLEKTGLTVYQALSRAIASAHHLDILPRPLRKLRVPNAGLIGAEDREVIEGDARMLVDRMQDAEKVAPFWRNARRAPVRPDDAEDLAEDLGALLDEISAFLTDIKGKRLRELLPRDIFDTAGEAETTTDTLKVLAANANADADLIEAFRDDSLCLHATAYCDARDREKVALSMLSELLTDPEAEGIDEVIAEAAALAEEHEGSLDPNALQHRHLTAEQQHSQLQHAMTLAQALPARWAKFADSQGTTLAEMRLDIESLLRTPDDVLRRRQPDNAMAIPICAREAAATQRQLQADLLELSRRLPGAGSHKAHEVREAADTIQNSGFFRFLSGPYKRAMATYRGAYGGRDNLKHIEIGILLRTYADWADRRDAFARDTRLAAALGDAFQGIDSSPEFLEALATYYSAVASLTKGNDRLRYAIETGDLEPLRDFAAVGDMPDITLRAAEAATQEAEEVMEACGRYQGRAFALCQAFKGRACVDQDMITGAQVARAALLRARQELAESPAYERLSKIDDTSRIRIAALLAGQVKKLRKPELGVTIIREGIAGTVLQDAMAAFPVIADLAARSEAIIDDLDMPHEGAAASYLAGAMPAIRTAIAAHDGLILRGRMLRAIDALEAHGFGDLIDWMLAEEGRHRRPDLPFIVNALIDRSMTDLVETQYARLLDASDGADLDRLRRGIAQIDRELQDLSRQVIRDKLITNARPPMGNGYGKVSTYTDMSLIRHEMSKQRRRASSRELTARAGKALLELKPCWMMSPLAVAQYLRNDFVFDLVVIDEASQMTPENALGAIKRAKQVIVVGDTKQLPPTNFFSKVLDDSDQDEDTSTDSESILDMANASFTPVRQLRWHYRSRHPSLIAISNKLIYDSQLTIFPAARDDDPDLGVHLVEVEGKYQKGRNVPEAHAIVAGAIEHMRHYPDRSLGLASMNREQTDLIVEEFERERARHPHVEAYIERWATKDDGLEEFFVKNLETIQGDERDVIMISTLYGPDADSGKVHQRFGPINSIYGHRRLNVLFSRAKEKVVTYTSLKPTDIAAEGKAVGLQVFRAWLEFSKTGQITDIQKGTAATDSPFEDFVIAQIQAAGYEAVPQVGASGYRIDIGVRHPSWPYGFILAVECDGAQFHSSRSSRDRDRLRQQVLEGLGWHFHRIWSTDWFRDPRTQIERLRAALDGALERAKQEETRRQEQRNAVAEAAQREIEAAIAKAAAESAGQITLFDMKARTSGKK